MSHAEASAQPSKRSKRQRDSEEEEQPPASVSNDAEGEEGEGTDSAAGPSRKPTTKRKRKTISPGIIYISRIPPGMTPQKVKHLMGRWGEVGKVYAHRRDAPDGPRHTQNTKQKQRNAKYDEAWIEFMDKEVAKTVARMLNAEIIGGKKGDRWREEIWTMKYLSGFKWEMLGEQVAYERQVHQARLRNEIAKAKTEQEEYLRNVELARVLELRKARKKGSAPKQGQGRDSVKGSDGGDRFQQRQVARRGKEFEEKGMSDVLGSVFG